MFAVVGSYSYALPETGYAHLMTIKLTEGVDEIDLIAVAYSVPHDYLHCTSYPPAIDRF